MGRVPARQRQPNADTKTDTQKQLEAQDAAEREVRAELLKYFEEYPLKWPGHCKHCKGWAYEERQDSDTRASKKSLAPRGCNSSRVRRDR
jgi:hypothetical protein